MSQWVINGLRTGIKTTVYPRDAERAAGVTPGLPCGCDALTQHRRQSAGGLLSHASVQPHQRQVSADTRRCIHCYRCVRGIEHPAAWQQTYEWATVQVNSPNEFDPAFKHSIHICVVDAGDCGACLNEVKQLNNPYYNMHRLGFFITPSPRHADVLLVVGPVTDHMRVALKKIYDAMPTPKRVVAVGACALTGGVFSEQLCLRQRGGRRAAGGRGSAGKPAATAGDFAWLASGGWTQIASIAHAALHRRWKPMRRNCDGNTDAHSRFFRRFAARAFCCRWQLRVATGKCHGLLGCLAAIALVLAGANALLAGETFNQPLWSLPGLATLTVSPDRLSAVFIFVTGLVLFPASIFAGGELRRESHHHYDCVFTVLLLGLYASIVLIFIAGDALLFLLAWEVMSILCWLLILLGRDLENDRVGAGYLLLAMGEAGTLAAALGFLLLAVNAGSLDFATIKSSASGLSAGAHWTIFLLSFFGFGVKAGLVPVNFWLPRAYTAAPRAFVPVLAGATLNLGLYGILRVNADLMPATHAGRDWSHSSSEPFPHCSEFSTRPRTMISK
jgi:Ni,Fe-hydrogenase III small subunit